jgi:hypothetical protein
VRRLIVVSVTAVLLCIGVYGLTHWRNSTVTRETDVKQGHPAAQRGSDVLDTSRSKPKIDSLSALDAHGFNGVREITKDQLLKLITKFRPLSQDENTNLNRGCPGFVCLYQGLGVTRWPELARGTVAYLILGDALKRHCPNAEENFVFVKQGWWLAGRPPTPNPRTGQVSINSVTRIKPGWYSLNYAVYFPSTATYAWINHREYGFPANLVKPQKAYLSLSPPPLNDESRTAQIYCSTRR